MAESNSRFRVNAPQVIHETIDGEVVIVNLETGAYYSTTGVGAEVWERVAAGVSVGQVVSGLCGRYDAAAEVVSASVGALVDELRREGLIVDANGGSAGADAVLSPAHPPTSAFVAPFLEKHTDVQDLLVLDPIHDVDDSGWPRARRDADDGG